MVKTQVEAQIKVRDLSKMAVSIQPAEYASWQDARTELIIDAKKPLKAQMNAELSTATSDGDADAIRDAFSARERQIEHEVDHKPLEFHMQLGVDYNVRRNSSPTHFSILTRPRAHGSFSRSRRTRLHASETREAHETMCLVVSVSVQVKIV